MPARQKPAAGASSGRARADEFVTKLASVLSSQSNVTWTVCGLFTQADSLNKTSNPFTLLNPRGFLCQQKARVSKAFSASLAELPESRQKRELQVLPLGRQPCVTLSGLLASVGST